MNVRRIALGALVAGAVAVAVVLFVAAGDDSIKLKAEFDNASGLRVNSAVKIAGAPVGKVTSLDLGKGDLAVAEIEVERGAGPIGRGAQANVRPSNLLGEKYVEIVPGNVKTPLPQDGTIPHSRTSAPTELDDLLDVLDEPTRFALRAFFTEQGKALVGRGNDLAVMLSRMPPALDRTRGLLAGLAQDNRALARLVVESDRVLESVGPRHRALGRLVASAGGALDTLASRREWLGDTVRRAPGTIAEVHHSLVELDHAARPLGPAARGLRESAPGLTAMLRELPPFTNAAVPTLQTAQRVGPSLDLLGRRASPVVERLGPQARELRRFAGALDPATSVLNGGWADTLGLMEGWARTIQNRDAAGHVFRVGLGVSNDVLATLRDQFIAPPSGRQPRRHARSRLVRRGGGRSRPSPQVPTPSLHIPGLPDLPQAPQPGLPHPPAAPQPGLPQGGDRTATQVLDYLLGP